MPVALVMLSGLGLAVGRSIPLTVHASAAPAAGQSLLAGTVTTVHQTVSGAGSGVAPAVNTAPVANVAAAAANAVRAASPARASSGQVHQFTVPTPPVGPTVPAGERAATLYSPDGITLLGAVPLLSPEFGLCDTNQNAPAGPKPFVKGTTATGTTTSAADFPLCNTPIPADPLIHIDLLTDQFTNFRITDAPTTSAESQVVKVKLLPGAAPGGADVLDATVLTSNTSATCPGAGTPNGAATASASILTLSIAGNDVIAASSNPDNQAIAIGPLATVVLDYHATSASAATGQSAAAAGVIVNFPDTGPLAPLIKGTLYISYTQSDLKPADCTPPKPPCNETNAFTEDNAPLDAQDKAVAGTDEENEGVGDDRETWQHECEEEAAGEHPAGDAPTTSHVDTDSSDSSDSSSDADRGDRPSSNRASNSTTNRNADGAARRSTSTNARNSATVAATVSVGQPPENPGTQIGIAALFALWVSVTSILALRPRARK